MESIIKKITQIIKNKIKMLIRLLIKKKENMLLMKLNKPKKSIMDLQYQKMNNILHMEHLRINY